MYTPKNVHVVGVTGGIASGKSTVRETLAKFDFIQVLDADKLGHLAYAPGTETLETLVSCFGSEILAQDGSVNRAKLGGIVFSDRTKLEKLNEIVWPAIRRLAMEEIRKCSERVRIFVFEAAVLVEALWMDIVDEIWVVRTSNAKEWLMKRNNISEQDALTRIQSQAAMNEKREEVAHVFVDNDGTKLELVKKVHAALTALEKRLCMISSNGSELVDIVHPETNQVIDVRKRSIVRAFNLPHRATYVILLHEPSGKYIVQQRSASKEYAPLFFDPAPGGVVSAGESYEENAQREMEEEMGITGVPFKKIGDFWFESDRVRCWGRIFLCVVDNDFPSGFELQECEVDSILLLTEEEISLHHRTRMTRDGLTAFEHYCLKTTSRI